MRGGGLVPVLNGVASAPTRPTNALRATASQSGRTRGEGRGQAQGPLPSTQPPLVPTRRVGVITSSSGEPLYHLVQHSYTPQERMKTDTLIVAVHAPSLSLSGVEAGYEAIDLCAQLRNCFRIGSTGQQEWDGRCY